MNITEFIMSLEIGLIYGMVAIGIYLTFRVIDFPDLTCDGGFVLGAASSSILIKVGVNPWLALLVAFFAGNIAGLITGLLNTYLKVTNLLAGILVAFMLYSINLKVMGGLPNIALITQTTIFTGNNQLLILCILCSLVYLLYSYLLITDFGLAMRSIGQNQRLASNCGIRVKEMTVIGLMLSNGVISLGGAIFSQHQGFADVSQGIGTIIIGLAAVMIGEKLLPFRTAWSTVLGCLFGSIIYRLFICLALHNEKFGLETQDLNLITGLMVVGIMVLPHARRIKC